MNFDWQEDIERRLQILELRLAAMSPINERAAAAAQQLIALRRGEIGKDGDVFAHSTPMVTG